MYEKNNFCHPVTLASFSIEILVNSKTFNFSLDLPLTHLKAQIACYELKGDLISVMLKKILHDSFENYKDLYGKSCKRDWMAKVVFLIQIPPTFGSRCNRYF